MDQINYFLDFLFEDCETGTFFFLGSSLAIFCGLPKKLSRDIWGFDSKQTFSRFKMLSTLSWLKPFSSTKNALNASSSGLPKSSLLFYISKVFEDIRTLKELSGSDIVEVLFGRENVLGPVFLEFEALVFLLHCFEDVLNCLMVLDELVSLDWPDILNGATVIAATQNAEVNKLIKGEIKFFKNIVEVDLDDRVGLGFDTFDEDFASESQTIHIIWGDSKHLVFVEKLDTLSLSFGLSLDDREAHKLEKFHRVILHASSNLSSSHMVFTD